MVVDVLGVVLVVVGVMAFCLFGLRRRLAHRLLQAPRQKAARTPDSLGLAYVDVSIGTENGKRLAGWYIPTAHCRPGIVLIHGWGGNAATLLPLAPVLHNAGYSLLLLEARNHGESDSDGLSSMVKFAQDLEHGLDWLKQQPHVEFDRLAVVGHSVGGAAALLVASRCPQLKAVASIGAFAHSVEVIQRQLLALRLHFRPFSQWVVSYMQQCIGAMYDDIAPATTIRKIACPVLLIHGDRDAQVPVEDARRIFANRAYENVRLWILPKTGHKAVLKLRRRALELVDFLDASLR